MNLIAYVCPARVAALRWNDADEIVAQRLARRENAIDWVLGNGHARPVFAQEVPGGVRRRPSIQLGLGQAEEFARGRVDVAHRPVGRMHDEGNRQSMQQCLEVDLAFARLVGRQAACGAVVPRDGQRPILTCFHR